jgi:hypothetical protein
MIVGMALKSSSTSRKKKKEKKDIVSGHVCCGIEQTSFLF